MILELICLILIFYYLITMKRSYRYWNDKGVKTIPPLPFIGNMVTLVMRKQTLGAFLHDVYKAFPEEKYIGFYEGTKPYLLLKDPQLIREIMVNNFDSFKHRSINFTNEKITDNIVLGNEDTWDYWRKNLSPIFASSKLKRFFPVMVSCSQKLCDVVEQGNDIGLDTNIQDIIDQYTTHVSALAFLNIEEDTYKTTSQLMKINHDILNSRWQATLLLVLNRILKGSGYFLHKYLNCSLFSTETKQFFIDIVNNKRSNTEFSQGLLDKLAAIKKDEEFVKKFDIDDEKLAAQVFMFFAAGLETTSRTLSFVIHELALNPDVQEKLHNEITTVVNKYGEINYDAVQDMKYLHMVFDETVRKFPVADMTMRKCRVAKFVLPETDVVIEKGTNVYFSLLGLHRDEKYFSNPEKFDPERFADEKKDLIKSGTYLPFGFGPRHCIGMRFAKLTVKAAVVELLLKFKFDPPTDPKHQFTKTDPTRHLAITPLKGLWVKISPRA